MSANQEQIFERRHAVGHRLVQGLPVRGGVDHGIVVALGQKALDALKKGLGLDHHPGASAKGVVVDLFVLAAAKFAEVVQMNLDQALGLRPL